MTAFLRDIQLEQPYIESRWKLSEGANVQIATDDVGGAILLKTGNPSFGHAPIVMGDQLTCAQGGFSGGALSGFQASIAAFNFGSGVTLEGATARDPNGVSFNLFNAPGQASLVIAGANVQFSIWTGAQHTLTASNVIIGTGQLVIGTYDPVAQLQTIYVDGAQVAQTALSGAVAGATTGNTQILVAVTSSTCVALGQDIAIYNGAIPASRVLQHYQAFAQTWTDPGHITTYPAIGSSQ